MNYPNFNEPAFAKGFGLATEKKLWKQGIEYVVGLDEAGRGPLAGPVVAAAVCVKVSSYKVVKLKVNDSKKLSEKERESLYTILTNHPQISWGVGLVSEKVIDKINVLEATKLAMEKALTDLRFKIQDLRINYLLIDGNFGLLTKIPQQSIIKGDEKVFSIAAASIIAKVTRDRLMRKMHQKYPQYGFAAHKGYGTAAHISSLKSFGPCKIHRKTFFPVSEMV